MRTILLTTLLMLSPLAQGQSAVDGLYTGQATVENQRESERKTALPRALKQVFQKLSGLREFEDYPLMQEVLADAAAVLVSFHYRDFGQMQADGSTIEELRLVANFSRREVDELMKALQLPLWEPQRKAIEVWVLVDDGLDRRILPVEFEYAWRAMDEVASARGLALNWPKTDEEGNYPVDQQLLWGGYTEDLTETARNANMVAAARREGPEWNVRINLSYGGENWTWRSRDVDLQWALTSGIEQAADLVAQANTIAAADQGRQVSEVTVTGIVNAQDYARCLNFLQNLSVVEQVTVASARAGLVRFRLELNALPLYLENALSSASMFEFQEAENSYLLLK
jgi:hypothetical protein